MVEVKRSDSLWSFAFGDVLAFFFQLTPLTLDLMTHLRVIFQACDPANTFDFTLPSCTTWLLCVIFLSPNILPTYTMKAIFLFIFVTIFSKTMTKQFLVTLDKDKGEESEDKPDIIEEDKKEEEVNNAKDSDEKAEEVAKGVNPKATRRTGQKKTGNDNSDLARPKQSSSVRKTGGQDYSGGMNYRKPIKYKGGGGTEWECRFRKSPR